MLRRQVLNILWSGAVALLIVLVGQGAWGALVAANLKATPSLPWAAPVMADDAYRDLCDQFIVFSGDSDLVPAVNMVRLRFPHKKIIVYVPSQNPVRGAAVELRTSAHVNRTLPAQLLSKSQFPNTIPDGAGGTLTRPASWV
jgi:hypothetical protein